MGGQIVVAPPTVAGVFRVVRMHIVEPWRLFLLSSASLCGAGVESTGAHGIRTCRPFASSAFGCECLSSPQRVVVHGRAESLSTDSAEGTVAPLRDL